MSPPFYSYSVQDNYCYINPEDVDRIILEHQTNFENLGLEIHPFKIDWYNKLVAPEYALEYHGDTLALLVISAPSMFEKAFLPFLTDVIGPSSFESNSVYFDPIDKCMRHYFALLSQELSASTGFPVESIHDFELHMPQRRPKILLQTAAHISGAAYYYKIQNRKHRLGVCIHPKFGGWFGIRGAFIFPRLLVPTLQSRPAPDVVPPEKQSELLKQFNENWKDWTYRDIIPVQDRYSDLQIQYFTLKPRDRVEFIRSTIFPTLIKQRLSDYSNG